jgi:hypothetical protein
MTEHTALGPVLGRDFRFGSRAPPRQTCMSATLWKRMAVAPAKSSRRAPRRGRHGLGARPTARVSPTLSLGRRP